jgi:hypothetical protein
MNAYAALLKAIAALLSAIIWPAALLVVIFAFKNEIRTILGRIPILFDRVKKASLGGVALELEKLADSEAKEGSNKEGAITPKQFEAAARIAVQANTQELLSELDQVCLEYDSLRRLLPPGNTRTQAMTRIVVKMRSLAPSLVSFIEPYKGSGSPGSRLAAIAMMQMVPSAADLEWLRSRFSSEQPFVFYHAALALQNIANSAATVEQKAEIKRAAKESLAAVESFKGVPDKGTIDVLKMLLDSLPKH